MAPNRPAWVHRALCRPFRRYELLKARLERLRSSLVFDAPIHPFRLITVDPLEVTEMLEQPFDRSDFLGHAPVVDGDWDEETESLYDYDLFYSVYNHFKHDVPWEETDVYSRIRAELAATEQWSKWGCESLEDFEERCRRLDALYEQIATEGYRTQRELRGSSIDPMGVRRCRPPEWHEVTVHVGRDGDLVFHEGRHRLAIVHALELESIPVRIMARHKAWQSIRDDVYTNGIEPRTSEFRSHPDIQPLIDP